MSEGKLGAGSVVIPVYFLAVNRFFYKPRKKRLQEDVVRFHEETRSNLHEVETTYAKLVELHGQLEAHTAKAYDEIRRTCDEVGIPYPQGVENWKTLGK